jgi:hypothetical protein
MENLLFWEVVEGPKTFEQDLHVEHSTLVQMCEGVGILF